MGKTLINLHLYLYNDHLINIARTNIKKIKSYGFDILVTSALELPSDFYQFCDYIFIDHENPQFTKKYSIHKPVNFFTETDTIKLTYTRYYQQLHSLPVLKAMVKGCKIAQTLGYENVIRLVYDCELGIESSNSIYKYIDTIESKNHDMIVYENIRDNDTDSDISTQIMYYKIKPFLELFDGTDNEDSYITNTKKLGYGNVVLDLEIFLYRFIKNSTKNILFLDGPLFLSEYNDSLFNQILSTKDDVDSSGFLYDVMLVDGKDNEIALSVYNQHTNNKNTIKFEGFDFYGNNVFTETLRVNDYGMWSWSIKNLNEVSINTIKTTHLETLIEKNYITNIGHSPLIELNERPVYSTLNLKK
jgi:hypothetical protein